MTNNNQHHLLLTIYQNNLIPIYGSTDMNKLKIFTSVSLLTFCSTDIFKRKVRKFDLDRNYINLVQKRLYQRITISSLLSNCRFVSNKIPHTLQYYNRLGGYTYKPIADQAERYYNMQNSRQESEITAEGEVGGENSINASSNLCT